MRAKTQKRENEYFDNNLKDPKRIYEILESLFQMSSWSEKYIYMIALTEDDDIQGVFEILYGEENAFSIYPEKENRNRSAEHFQDIGVYGLMEKIGLFSKLMKTI